MARNYSAATNRTRVIEAIERTNPKASARQTLALLEAIGLPTTLGNVMTTRSTIRAKNRQVTVRDVYGRAVRIPVAELYRLGFHKAA